MPGPRAAKLAVALIGLGFLAGCSHAEVVGNSRTLHIALGEYRLNPARAELSAGVVTIYIRNFGRLTHNLVISEYGQVTASTKPISPGQSTVLALNLAPGTYLMDSTLLSDRPLGMYGTLEVRP